MRLAASWILTDSKQRLLLLKRSDYSDLFAHHWIIPGWRWDPWETAEEIVVREVKEESGLDFVPTKLYHSFEQNNLSEHVQSHRYLWTWSGKVDICTKEADGYAWYTYEETKNLKIAFDYAEVIEKLYNDWLIK